MTRHPFDSSELGRNDPEMDRLGADLERYSAEVRGEPPMDLAARIQAAIDDEPSPVSGWWGSLLAVFASWRGPARLALGTAVVVAAVVAAIVVSDLADGARTDIGSTPPPSVIVTPSPSPTSSPTPSSTPTPTLSPTPTPSLTPSPSVAPSASDDHGGDVETPEPSESDNSGSGSGNSGSGSGNSGSGSGNSGSGSGNSGPGSGD